MPSNPPDPFTRKNTADEKANNQKIAKEEITKHKALMQQKFAKKPEFNDVPKYKPKWAF